MPRSYSNKADVPAFSIASLINVEITDSNVSPNITFLSLSLYLILFNLLITISVLPRLHLTLPLHLTLSCRLTINSSNPILQVSEYSNSDGTSGFNYSRLEEEHGTSIIAVLNAANGGGRSPERCNTSFTENSSSSSSSGGRKITNFDGSLSFPDLNLKSSDASKEGSNYSDTANNNTQAFIDRTVIADETAQPLSWDQTDQSNIHLSDQESCSSSPHIGRNILGTARHEPCAMVTVSDLTGTYSPSFLFLIFHSAPQSLLFLIKLGSYKLSHTQS